MHHHNGCTTSNRHVLASDTHLDELCWGASQEHEWEWHFFLAWEAATKYCPQFACCILGCATVFPFGTQLGRTHLLVPFT